MLINDQLSYEHYLKFVLNKVKKTTGLIRKCQQSFPRYAVITIFKSFIQSNLEYCDIVCGRAYKDSFHKNLEFIRYNTAIAITGAIRDTSSEKVFQELCLESLKSRRWLRKLYLFYKIFQEKFP